MDKVFIDVQPLYRPCNCEYCKVYDKKNGKACLCSSHYKDVVTRSVVDTRKVGQNTVDLRMKH